MISRKELEYVNSYAKNAPFPGVNYATSVMDELIKAYELYKQVYMDKDFSFTFSNGEEINFELFSKNLAHMLGIDFKSLTSDAMAETVYRVLGICNWEHLNSFEVLTRILERADDVIENDSDPKNGRIMNYYKSMIKSAIFLQLSEFDKFNFGCINFNSNIYNSNNDSSFFAQSTKLLFTQSHEAVTPYFMMGLKYSENDRKYIPETLFAPENFETFFYGQELVLPTQILSSKEDGLVKITATNEEKIHLLNLYKSIISSYQTNSNINIYSDYENMLSSSDKEKVKIK